MIFRNHALCRLLQTFAMVIVFCVSLSVHAADEYDTRTSEPRTPPKKLWLYFGGNGGLAKLSSDLPALELDKSGYAINAKALLSYYWENFVLDFGPGYSFNRLKGDGLIAGTTVRIYTDTFFAEVSPRYRAGDHWQLGLVGNLMLGSDVGFSEYLANAQKSSFLIGPRINYETLGNHSRWRFGGQMLMDMNIANRGLMMFMIDVQYGFPICCTSEREEKWVEKTSAQPVVQELAPPVEPETPMPPIPQTITVETIGDSIRIQLPEAVLRFATNSSNLTDRGEAILAQVAEQLQKHPEAWTNLVVTGHTDQRGTNAANIKLSRARAKSVARQLANLGIPGNKIRSRGRGEEEPLDRADNANAWGRNRRVQIDVKAAKGANSDLADGLKTTH